MTAPLAADWRARPDGPDYGAVRQRLLDATSDLIAAEGLGALRLDAVAARAGLHRSSIYRYFRTRDELVLAAVVAATLRVGRQVIDDLGPDAPPERYLVDGVAAAIAAMARDPVLASLGGPAASPTMGRVAHDALRDGVRPLVEPMFDAAVARGVLREGVTPDDAVRWLEIVVLGLLAAPEALGPGEVRDLLGRMLVPALLCEPDNSSGGE